MNHAAKALLLLLALGNTACAVLGEAQQLSVATFTEMETLVRAQGAEAVARSLIVMDDDDTLTMMPCPDATDLATCQYLGGPAWYAWQLGLQGGSSPYKVASDEDDLLGIANLLLALNNMVLTETAIPGILDSLAGDGARLLVLTARGPGAASATAGQFAHITLSQLGEADFAGLISSHALADKRSGKPGFASPDMPAGCRAGRPVTYQQGVMYIAGQNKGDLLLCLLGLTDSADIRYIYFIDDTLANVVDVYQAFLGNRHYQVKAMHYTALSAHKDALTDGERAAQYQRNANDRWQAIRAALTANLQSPAALE